MRRSKQKKDKELQMELDEAASTFPIHEPMAERIRDAPVHEFELKKAFNSILDLMNKVCSDGTYTTDMLPKIKAAHDDYFGVYDTASKSGCLSFLPRITRNDIAVIMEYALNSKSFKELLSYYREEIRSPEAVTPEAQMILYSVFREMSEVANVTKRFCDVFSKHGFRKVTRDDIEYKQLQIWMHRLIEVYPSSDRKQKAERSVQPQPIQPEESAPQSGKQEPAKAGRKRAYKDPLKAGLKANLDLIQQILRSVDSFKPIDEDAALLDSHLTAFIGRLAEDKSQEPIVYDLWTLQEQLKKEFNVYNETGYAISLKSALNELKDELFEMWPSS